MPYYAPTVTMSRDRLTIEECTSRRSFDICSNPIILIQRAIFGRLIAEGGAHKVFLADGTAVLLYPTWHSFLWEKEGHVEKVPFAEFLRRLDEIAPEASKRGWLEWRIVFLALFPGADCHSLCNIQQHIREQRDAV